MMETEMIDRLFLELSQVTAATTPKERALEMEVRTLMRAMEPFAYVVSSVSGTKKRIPTEHLNAADWSALAKAYVASAKLRK